MVIVEDLIELQLLNRVLMAARFKPPQGAQFLLGSAGVASLHARVVDAIVAHPDAFQSEWVEWRRFDRRMFEPDLIVLVVQQMEAFFTMSLIDQTALLRICVSPFVATDEEVEELRVRCLVGPSEAVS
jgi:hypothetical protein